jgi:hypothetical protein
MADIEAYTPIKTMAAYFLDEVDKSSADIDKIWLLMLRGLVKLRYAFAAEPETIRVPVPANKIVSFPNGLLKWSKIGLLNESGEVSTLKINTGLTTWRDESPLRITDLASANINDAVGQLAAAPLYLNYYYNNCYYNLFGLGNGLIQYGECRIDEGKRLIVLSLDFQYDSILIEGIYAPEKTGGDYLVPTSLMETMIAFAKWKTGHGTRQEFYAEATESRRTIKPVNLQNINQVIRESQAMKLRG